jgi:hypothetical protein
MSQGARLTTIDAVPLLKAALQAFADEAATALADFDMELGRAMEWIGHDRPDHWRREIRATDEKVAELRLTLERAMMFKTVDGHQPSCQDERKALYMAKQRMQKAEETLDMVRHWGRVLDRDIIEFRAIANQLASWLQVDLPKALNTLERMRSALETYVAIESPAEAPAIIPVAAPERAELLAGSDDTPPAPATPSTDPPCDGRSSTEPPSTETQERTS